jgi:hypothetical protein
MKKLLVLSLIGLLILAFGVAYAQEKKEEPKLEFKASGFIDAQTFWYRNVTPGNPASGIYDTVAGDYKTPGSKAYDKTVSYLESRARLKFDAAYGKNVSGTIFFEMDSSRWGETAGGNLGKVSERNTFGYWSADRAALEIKNVFIDFGVPGIPVPVTMKVGLQPLSIRPNMLVYTDGMGVTMGIKIDPVTISPLWFKALEGKDARADDVDVYGLHIFGKVETLGFGGYGLYYDMKSYPFFGATLTCTNNPATNVVTCTQATEPAYGAPATDNKAKMWWLGLYTDGKVGPADLNFDFIYDFGKVESRTAGIRDVDYSGWATRLKIDYPWEAFNFGLVGMYASGADTKKTNSAGTANGTNRKVGSYVVPPGSEAGGIFGESLVVYSSWVNRGDSGIGTSLNYTAMCRGPIGGTWMAKLYGSYKATPWYKVTLQGLYIGDTTKHGNTFGTARKAPYGATDLRDDKTIGWEFDMINEIQIYKQLKYTIAGGLLIPGKALRFYQSTANPDDKPKTPWIITSNLTYTF